MGNDDTPDAMTVIRQFKREEFPKVLVSVNMLDTGFDCPELVNLVMARFTKSAILYQQMRGRGTRKSTLIPKSGFTIFDFVGVTDYHGDDDEEIMGGFVVVKEPGGAKPEPRKLLVLDAKVGFDSNALYRHPDLVELRDLTEEDPAEVEASKYDLAFIKLDGNIGCLVNGAGLAMATMDIIKLNGAEPANFLDVGGGADKEKVTNAFKLILKDPAVQGILVNIFGGIMRCDIIAEGIIAAAKEVSLSVPLVVRLEGTNVELGKEILANSGLPIVSADNLGDAAAKIVAEVKKAA
jgi:hypothetical protein